MIGLESTRSSHRNINEFWYNLFVSLSWFVNDLFPFTFENCEVKCKTLILLVSRLIDLDWSQWSPKYSAKERVKVKIKSTYRISNCQHQLNVAVTATRPDLCCAWWSPAEDHAWGSSVICFLKWSVRLGALSFFICLFDIVFESWHSSQFPADRHLQQTVATSIDSNDPSFVIHSLIRWERLFVLSFIQAFNCQATKCKQISSRSSSNNHKSLQPFSRYWSWNMQHATWKHDRDCRVRQVPQVDACTQNELAFKLPHWLVHWV